MTEPSVHSAAPTPARSLWADAIRQTFVRTGARLGLVWIVVMALLASFGPLLCNSMPYAVQTKDGEIQYPLLANLTTIDFVWLMLPVAVVGAIISTRVSINLRIVAVASAMVIGTPLALGHQLWAGFGALTGSLGAIVGGLLSVLIVVALLGIAYTLLGQLLAYRKLLLLTVFPVVCCALLVLIFRPTAQQNLDYSQWREARHAGNVEWIIPAPVQFSPNDRLRDVSSRVDKNRVNRRLADEGKEPLDPVFYDVYGPLPEKSVDLQPPSRTHWMGTTYFGEDVLARMVGACRIALTIGIISTGIATTIGIVIGSLMGYLGGWVDLLGMRMIEILESLPRLIILLIVTVSIGRNLYLMMCVIGLLGWTGDARFIRAEFLRLRKLDFVQAGLALGLPRTSIVFKHMLPNGIAPVLVNASFGIAGAILLESTLSFLGLGLLPSEPSWGQLLEQARQGTSGFNWWIAVFPGGAIFLTVFSYILIGESMRDALDPKLKKRE
jgi:peptide/nickel transport system permease protein